MRTLISTFLIASAVLAPSMVQAESLLAITYTHPNAVPPTKAPATPLPPTSLPDGEIIIPIAPSSAEETATSTEMFTPSLVGSSGAPFTFTNIAVLLTIGMALILLLLVNIGWFFRQKRKTN